MNPHTCSFVNTMPKYIHSNINAINAYRNTDVINMHMYTYIYRYINIYYIYIIYIIYILYILYILYIYT